MGCMVQGVVFQGQNILHPEVYFLAGRAERFDPGVQRRQGELLLNGMHRSIICRTLGQGAADDPGCVGGRPERKDSGIRGYPPSGKFGAASGIGFALAAALLQAGAVVFMADRDTKTLAAAVEQMSPYAGRVHSLSVHVTNQEQVQHMVEDAAARHGRLDFLFNNAGIGGTFQISEVTLEHWRRIIDINLWGVIYGVQSALPIMRRQGGGHIVNTASIAGLVPPPFQALYCATKYAVVGLSESLRFELGEEGIHVSVVCPGNVATPIFGPLKPPKTPYPQRRPRRLPSRASPINKASSSFLKNTDRCGVGTGVPRKPSRVNYGIWPGSAVALFYQKDRIIKSTKVPTPFFRGLRSLLAGEGGPGVKSGSETHRPPMLVKTRG